MKARGVSVVTESDYVLRSRSSIPFRVCSARISLLVHQHRSVHHNKASHGGTVCLYSTAGWHVYCPVLVSLIVSLLLVSACYVPTKGEDRRSQRPGEISPSPAITGTTQLLFVFVAGDYDWAHKSVSTRKDAKVIITKNYFNALA